MPRRDEGRRASMLVSIAVHALIIGLFVVPFFLPDSVIARIEQGAGGAGPAGGGGGGRRGTGGGTVETLRYVRLAPDPVPTPTTLPVVPPPPKVELPKAEPPKPKPVETPPAKAPEQQSVVPAPQTTVAAATPGVGGGSGADGTAGAGPGSGGGVGAGVGTGRGNASGPGTGGGNQTNYPPQPIEFFLPPLPAPSNVRGFKFIAEFEVDSTGRVLEVKFTETPNGDYNRRLFTVLRAMRFRPGTRPDGTPLRMKAQVGYEF
jgi:protein TonB